MCLKKSPRSFGPWTYSTDAVTHVYVYYVSMQGLIASVQNDYGKVSLKSVNADKSFFAHAISDPKLGKEEPYAAITSSSF